MAVILLTNDDGIDAPGLKALEDPLAELGELWVVAPSVGRSACGRAVSLHSPLRVLEREPKRLAVDGTPTDCVLLAFRQLLPDRPKIVVSGINRGFNVGEDLDYSGTVAGAAEGALQGARVSVAASVDEELEVRALGELARILVRLVARWQDTPPPDHTFLNVNFPLAPTRRLRWTRQGNFLGTGTVERRIDPRGRPYYWIGDRPLEQNPPRDTDRGALNDGCISATLLSLDRSFQGSWHRPPLGDCGLMEG